MLPNSIERGDIVSDYIVRDKKVYKIELSVEKIEEYQPESNFLSNLKIFGLSLSQLLQIINFAKSKDFKPTE